MTDVVHARKISRKSRVVSKYQKSRNQKAFTTAKTILAVFSVLAMFVFTLSPLTVSAIRTAVVPTGTLDANTQVDVCHDNEGASDYSLVQAKVSAIVSLSNEGHPPDAQHAGDVLPPFDYSGFTLNPGNVSYPAGHYEGRNWDTDLGGYTGQELFLNNCVIPSQEPTEVDLSVEKTVSDSTPLEGDQVTYTITVTNNGPDDATGVEVSDVLPAGVTYVSDDGDYSAGVWTVGNLADGESATINIVVTVDSETAGDTIPNTASTSDNTDNDSNDSDSVSITVEIPGCTNPAAENYDQNATVDDGSCTFAAVFDLSVSKTVVQGETDVENVNVNSGTDVTFTVTVANAGPDTAPSVQVNDLLPTGLAYVSHLASVGSFDSGTGVWSVGDLTSSASATLSITATATGAGNDVLTNTASTTDSTEDDSNDSDSATVTINVPGPNDIPGCTDRTAFNFDVDATVDDGSCQYTLTITTSGDGNGEVNGEVIHCDSNAETAEELELQNCDEVYTQGTSVDLNVLIDEGSTFDGTWSTTSGSPVTNTCTGTNTSCAITVNGNITLNAHFGVQSSGGGSHHHSSGSSSGGQILGETTEVFPPAPTPVVQGATLPVTGASADLMIALMLAGVAPLFRKLNKDLNASK